MADNKLSLIVSFIGQDKLSGALKNLIGLGKSGDQALRGMTREAGNLRKEMKATQRAIVDAMQSGTGNIEELIAKERELAGAIAKVNSETEKQKRLNVADGQASRMTARGEQLKAKGTDNIVAGAALAAPLIIATKGAMEFSSGMVDIQQKAELTNTETAKMAANLLTLSRITRQLPEDMRSGVDVLAGFGLDPRQAMQMIGSIGRLGTAFKVDLADGAAAAYANVNNLKIPIGETSKALDIMAAGGKMGAFEVKDMARWFPALTASLQALGEKGTPAVADLTAALQVAMNTAGSADEAANNITNLLGKINSKATTQAFSKNFGMDLPAALKKFEAQGMTSMEAFAMAAKKATGGDMKKLSFVLEDRQAQMGLLALIQNMDKYREIRAKIGKGSGGTIDAAFDQRMAQDASVQWQGFMVQLQTMSIIVGTKLIPAFSPFLTEITAIMDKVGDWVDANPKLATGLAQMAAWMLVGKVALGGPQFAFGSILGPLGTVWSAFARIREVGSIAEAFPKVAQAFGALRGAAIFLAQGVQRAGLMLLTNPMVLAIVLIGAAIGIAAYLIYSNWDKIKAAFTGAYNYLSGVMSGITAFIRNNWTQIRNVMLGGIVIFMPFVAAAMLAVSLIYRNWGAISGFFRRIWSGIVSGASSAGQWVSGVWTRISGGAMAMVRTIGRIVGPFLAPFIAVQNYLSGLAGKFFNYGVNIISGLINGIVSKAGSLIGTMLNLAEQIGAKFAWALDMHSPSRVFMAMGGHITSGLGLGIAAGGQHPMRAMARVAAGVAGAGALSLAAPSMSLAAPALAALSAPARPAPALTPLSRPGGAATGQARSAAAAPGPITIHIHQQPGEDSEALAERVARLLEQRQRRAARTYADDF